ncbi:MULTISPECIES: sarcosine oxidase subunit gamma family protein [unclassified Mesorhizobium]|uniref:sarcosine oxidase subunit gamma n=1 Tax=unclassified Mesorhizobium TaxID=325217 RepID=UPI000FD59406|nr:MULTISPECIES: sarcosine oxidase subunit gamma family protein [unclassified Mesorhizobium]RVB71524.1 sarcosine oxidase subunit gamma [Mesorhizobium sp. M6A.T.Cr.TU.014.01.1.1]RWN60706.1 MAG: sarcosine oxidase subunit gamma [Mesorhizobium sp.]RWO94016.1 MAG: sarcosine oxidase subunit gamma [Mesorhizobium sp.]RWP75385.1 MAG: sarcosine oxidase subunit gamma [Mesorhizobium sp.]RWP95565.1 MAG: sarcosine oxidase subunit gamma [Mesorhizobium sp.]
MAEFSWVSRSPLEHALVVGDYGARDVEPGISLTEIRNFDLVQVMARRGKGAELASAAEVRFGMAAPDMPKAVSASDVTLIWSGPDQFFVLSKGGKHTIDTLSEAFSQSASLSDQSHARALIRVSGAKTRAMLAKLSSIDQHPAAFPTGTAAATSIDHTSVNLWRGYDRPDGQAVFNLLVFATFAESLWRTILDAAAEYGVEIGYSEELG